MGEEQIIIIFAVFYCVCDLFCIGFFTQLFKRLLARPWVYTMKERPGGMFLLVCEILEIIWFPLLGLQGLVKPPFWITVNF